MEGVTGFPLYNDPLFVSILTGVQNEILPVWTGPTPQ
jgi:hypothetical protein